MRVAVHPLSWTNEVIPEFGWDTPAETYLSEAREAGYEGVELGRNLPRDPAELRRMLDGHGLELVAGWHSGFLADTSVGEALEAIHADAALLAGVGAKVISYGECGSMAPGDPLEVPMSRRIRLGEIDVDGYAKRLTELAERVTEAHGLEFAYHHHLMMVAEAPEEVDELMSKAGPAVSLLFDTGHCVAGGGDPAAMIERHGERMRHIHLKDVRKNVLREARKTDMGFNDAVRAGMFAVPGDGDIDFAPVAEFVSSSGYEGWLTVEAEQDPAVHVPLPTVRRAREHVRKLFGS